MTPEERKAMLAQARERAQDQIQQDREDAQEHQWGNMESIIGYITSWQRWYCKKNQPRNYIRLMCRKPNHEHWRNVRSAWNCRIQVFKGPEFECDIRITAEAYETLSLHIENRREEKSGYLYGQRFQFYGWKDKAVQDDLYEYRIYENPYAK